MTGSTIAALQARVADLAELVAGGTASGTVSGTTSGTVSGTASGVAAALADGTDGGFATALAAALGGASGSGTDLLAGLSGLGGTGGLDLSDLLSLAGDGGTSLVTSGLAGVASVGTSSAAATGSPTGQDLVDAARAYIGVPYVWGGESLAEGGLDCSGLVQRSLADIGVTDVPRVARDQATLGTPVASLADAQPGDLLVFEGGKHIGIYVGDGQMIDAPRPGKTVQQRAVYETPTTIRHILPAQASGVSSTSGGSGGSGTASGSAADDVTAQRALVAALLAGATA